MKNVGKDLKGYSYDLLQGCTNTCRQVAKANKFCTATSNIFGPSVRKSMYFTILGPNFLRRVLDFCEICTSQPYYLYTYLFFRKTEGTDKNFHTKKQPDFTDIGNRYLSITNPALVLPRIRHECIFYSGALH